MNPDKKTIKVSFPCVHGFATGQLVTINCFQVDELKGPVKVVSGIDEQAAQKIIGSVRYKENDIRAASGVIVSFSNPLFSGESYGLALAIADKIARLGGLEVWPAMYATGEIPPDGCGTVGRINEFLAKIELVYEQGKEDSLFVFPTDNLSSSPDQIQEKLNQLKSRGIKYRAIRHINDLEGYLWRSSSASKKVNNHGSRVNQFWQLFNSRIIKNADQLRYIITFILLAIICILFLTLPAFQKNNNIEDLSSSGILGGNESDMININKVNNQSIVPGNEENMVERKEISQNNDISSKENAVLESSDIDVDAY